MITPEFLTSLPVDRRGIELLRAIAAGEQERGYVMQNRSNVRLSLEPHQWNARPPEALRAYEEGFDWIERKGLVARDPSQSSGDWFFITEAGWDVIEGDGGVARMQAAERLSVDRQVDFEDPVLASEVILLADLLHRMMDQVEDRQS